MALPIWIGPAEAQAIAMRLQGIEPPRPMTHDLLKEILDRTGVELLKVLIHELRGTTYYARVQLKAASGNFEVDCRPSDAIALAMRFKRPIFIAAALLQGEQTIRLPAAATQSQTIIGLTVQPLTAELIDYFGLEDGRGVLVSHVAEKRRNSLRPGDIILEIDGAPVNDVDDFKKQVDKLEGRADLSVQREGHRIHVAFEPAAE